MPADIVSPPSTDLSLLPKPVAAIREKILAACDRGELEALRVPIDWNETRPIFMKGAHDVDPIETLRTLSFDSRGVEIINVARAVLAQPYAKIQRGPVTIYEWPAFAGPPQSESDGRAQWSCVRFFDLARSMEQGRPRIMRMGFGADGVWHYFYSDD